MTNYRFNVTGTDRKRLVAAIVEILNTKQQYLGAPTFAYQHGDEYTLDKTGMLFIMEWVDDGD